MLCRLLGGSPRKRRHGRSLVIPTLGPGPNLGEPCHDCCHNQTRTESYHQAAAGLDEGVQAGTAARRHPRAMRETALHPTAGEPHVTIYDPSGLHADAVHAVSIDCGCRASARRGLGRGATRRPMRGRAAVIPAGNGSLQKIA